MLKKPNKCSICRSDEGEVLIDRDSPRHEVCKNCGFVYMNPIPDFEENKKFYLNDYWDEHHGFFGIREEYLVTNRQKRMQSWLMPYFEKGFNILEIGSGFGYNLDYLNKKNDSLDLVIEGLEISKAGCKNMQEAFGIPSFNETIEEFKPAKKYDVLIMSHVLEHFENPSTVLNKCHGLLGDEGLLWIEVPNIMYPNPTKNLDRWLSKEHISYFSPQKLKYLLEINGFEIVHQKFLHYVCYLVRKVDGQNNQTLYQNEYSDIKKALFRQRIAYFIFRTLSNFGFKTNKFNS